MSGARRVVVLGGTGRFGQLIARRLVADGRFDVFVAGRDPLRVATAARACGASALRLDVRDPLLSAHLHQANAWLVIDAAGPFQARDYAVARACIEARSHLVDIADGRDYVCGISSLDDAARAVGACVVSGASSVPALTGAVVDQLSRGMKAVEYIDIGITTSARPPGAATVAAILAYAGRPIPAFRDGGRASATGWGPIRKRTIEGLGIRRFSDCDVPDLELLPRRHPGVRGVRFGAGSESTLLHGALRAWSLLVTAGWPGRWRPSAAFLARAGDRLASSSGRSALYADVTGVHEGARVTRTWTLVAEGEDGAHIPGLPAVALAKRIAEEVRPGARPCIGLLALDDIHREMEGLRVAISETEVPA